MAGKLQHIVIDTDENDDWIKAAPTHKQEAKIHAVLGKKLATEAALEKAKSLRTATKP